jgi:AraC-like DNA-binding protein
VIDVSAGVVTYPPGGGLGPRAQHDVQLVLVHSGSARIWVDDSGPRKLRAGQVGLLLPGHRERFAFDATVPTRHSWLQARVAEVPDALARLPPSLPLSAALEALVREAIDAATLPTAREVAAHLAGAALWRYAGEAARARPELARPVDDARRFIDANLAVPSLTLDRIASAAHVTPAHLVRSFRAEHGTTPIAHLWQRRTALGVDLLTHTGLPLAVVAQRCGFRTVHHFSRRIKSATGLPPGALRAVRWGAR